MSAVGVGTIDERLEQPRHRRMAKAFEYPYRRLEPFPQE